MAQAPQTVNKAAPPQGDKPLVQDTKKPTTNAYFKSVSNAFRSAKHITVVVLALFLVFSFTVLRRDITLENLRYLLKFINFTNTETSISAAKINYSSGDPNRLGLFVGDLCTLTPSGYSLYDSRGNQIMSDEFSFKEPVLKISEKFTLCYDLGGTSFKIFNTFTKLYDEVCEYPITDAAISDNGSFAIGSSSRDYHTSVTFYNSDFEQKFRILRKDRLCALEFHENDDVLALMTFGARNGELYSTVETVVPGEQEAKHKLEISGLAYSLYCTDTGYCVVTDSDIIFLDLQLNEVKRVTHPSQIIMTELCKNQFAVLYSEGLITNSYHAVIYSAVGDEIYSGTLDGRPVGITCSPNGECIFFLTGTTLTRVNLTNKKIAYHTVASDAVDVLCQAADSVIVAYQNYANTYDLSDMKESYYTTAENEQTEAVQ